MIFYKENSIFKYEPIQEKPVITLEEIEKESDMLKNGETTPLHIWCERRDFNMIVWMCEKYPELDMNAIDYNGKTPLHVLFTCDTLLQETVAYIVSYFVLKGVDLTIPDKYGRLPLHLSCMYDMIEVTNYLINKGECINKADKYGKTPIYYAIEFGYTHVIKLLIERGAKVEFEDVPFQPLHIVCLSALKDQHILLEIIWMLVEAGANINVAHKTFLYTPLHNAVCLDNYYTTKLLLELGAKVNKIQVGHNTPIHYAKSLRIAKELVKWGADITIKNEQGQTAISKAKLYRNNSLIDYYMSLNKITSKPRSTPV
jgi:ankyrin repeat protein